MSLALVVAAPAQRFVFSVLRQPEGLKNLAVNAIARDRSGFLWVATENGLYRFLGSRFERYGPPQGIAEVFVRDLLSDEDGAIWAGTDENLYRWDGQRFQPALTSKNPITGSRQMAVEDVTHLLLLRDGQLYRMEHWHGNVVRCYPVIPESVLQAFPALKQLAHFAVVHDPDGGGKIWLSGNHRLYSFPLSALANPQPMTSAAVTEWATGKGLPDDSWGSVLLDHSGTLWAAGQKHIAVLTNGAARFTDRSIPGSDPENVYGYSPMIEDSEGRIMVPAEDGIARWDGHSWVRIGRANGLQQSSRITGMIFDGVGDLWMSSLGGGVYHWLGYRDWQGWSDGQGLPAASVWSLLPEANGEMLIGTDRGLTRVDPRSGSATALQTGKHWSLGQLSTLVRSDKGTAWAGTFSGGILRVDEKTGASVKMATLPAFIYTSISIPGEGIFYGTRNGIWGGKDSAHPQHVAAVDSLLGEKNSVVAACTSKDGAGWFLSGNRLLRLQDGQWSRLMVKGMSGLNSQLIALSCAPDGALWVTGQKTGTWKLSLHQQYLQAWKLSLPAEWNGLAPLSVLVDPRGWVWLGSDQGLVAWNGKEWRHLTQESGLIWDDVNQGAMIFAPDGSLWVGTSGGVAHLMHPEDVFAPLPMSVSLTAIRRGAQMFPPKLQLTLPWSSQPLVFYIASATMRNRSEMIYRYRMDGLQPDWSEDQDGDLNFPALPPGDYNLLAYAFNPALNASSRQIEIHLTILAPWWRSYWFFAFCILALVGLVYGFDRFRERQLRARSRELEQLVGERTRELEFSREQLRVQATHDGLTGMLNRRGVLTAVSKEMERSRREKRTLIVALVDLDFFKRINDNYGHLAGDEALRWFAASVGSAVRPYDLAGRYGGEEFLIALTQVPSHLVEQRLVRLHGAITNLQVRTRECEFSLNCTIGATVVDEEAGYVHLEAALAVADQALYEAKAAGRNRVILRRLNSDALPLA